MSEQLNLGLPLCRLCEGRGYTGCNAAHARGGGCYIAVAFRAGIACSCPAGREFAQMQRKWIDLDSPKGVL